MFENLSLLALQQYWWVIISLLGSLVVFFMFVQGGQTIVYQLAKSKDERTLIYNSIGRKWELAFTTLVTFGGAFFASFPLFYSTSFGGAYWVWFLILFGYIIQAVSYEYRSKPSNFLGHKTYEIFLIINGVLSSVLIGTVVGTFFTGSEFYINEYNLSFWQNPMRGLEAALNYINLLLGLSLFFLSRILGTQYIRLTVVDENISKRSKKQLVINSVMFLLFFLPFLISILIKDGYAVNPESKEVYLESFKYFNNFLNMPIVLIMFLLGVVLVLYSFYTSIFKNSLKSIWFSSIGVIMVVLSLLLIAGFSNTAYYPSNLDLQSSLTIENSSSSHYTLTAMSYVSLFVPFVIAYIWYTWKAMSKKKIDKNEIETNSHVY